MRKVMVMRVFVARLRYPSWRQGFKEELT